MSRKSLIRLAIVVVCLYLIVTTVASMTDLLRAGDKLTQRERALGVLTRQQEDLLRQEKKVNSPDFLEKVARDDLGLSKPGEEVLIIPPELVADHTVVATPDATPNWQKWAKLLF